MRNVCFRPQAIHFFLTIGIIALMNTGCAVKITADLTESTTTSDDSGSTNDSNDAGGETFTWADNYSLFMDPANNSTFVDLPDLQTIFNTTTSFTNFSMSVWVKTTGVPSGDDPILTCTDNDSVGHGITIAWSDADQIYACVGAKCKTPLTTLTPTDWNHIVIAYDGTQGTSTNRFTIYLNGASIQSCGPGCPTSIDVSTYASNCQIGRGFGSNSYLSVESYWDEVAIWNTTLDATNVAAIYNSGSPIGDLRSDSGSYTESAGLVAYYPMGDSDTEPEVSDRSGNSQDGTISGGSASEYQAVVP